MNRPNDQRFDVLGLGCATVDDFLYVPSFPEANQKARVKRSLRRCGGLTGSALVTAARLGARCAYAGTLGKDPLSEYILDNFIKEGVDVSHVPRSAKGGAIHSVVVVGQDTGSRNVFYEVSNSVGAHPGLPSEETIAAAKVLFIDHYGMAGNLRAMLVARAGGVAVVADFEDASVPHFQEGLEGVGHLILSQEFACQIARRSTAAEAALALWRPDRLAVIITCGEEGCWSVSADQNGNARHHAAFKVKAVDTTGCGDVFHGAYAASLAQGDPLEARIRFASAAAAAKAMQPDLPTRTMVEGLLRSQPGLSNTPKRAKAASAGFSTANIKENHE